eukprot:Pompholyxophrys_punicea_v1_NODE_1306_length_801_cov_1.568365.p1 type:complete len:162 gc:universal NODE_1306_length_801_cov_1.568365:212-697(+)
MLLECHQNQKSKYFDEYAHLIACCEAILPERLAHELTWNRFCNMRGSAGNNIARDLRLEFFIRSVKGKIKALHAQKHSEAISKVVKASRGIQEICSGFDLQNLLFRRSTSNTISPKKIQRQQAIVTKMILEKKIYPAQFGRLGYSQCHENRECYLHSKSSF